MIEDFPKYNPQEKSNTQVNSIIKGRNSHVSESATNVFESGGYNSIGANCDNITVFNSSGCTVLSGVRGATILNSSGVTVSEDNQLWINGSLMPNAPHKVWSVVLSQSGTSAPDVTTNENTLGGTPVWARDSQGAYTATLANAFPSNGKTEIIVGSPGAEDAIVGCFITSGTSEITVFTQSLVAGEFQLADDILSNTALKIITYS